MLLILSRHLWLFFILTGSIGALLVFFIFTNHRDSFSLLKYALYIAIFITLITGISLFPNQGKRQYLLLSLPFIFFLGFVCPKMNYSAMCNHMEEYYIYENIFLYPLIILSVCAAYRIGGGKSGLCIKTGLNGILLLFSGFLDLMWHVVNGLEYKEFMNIAIRTIIDAYGTSIDRVVKYKLSIPHIEIILGHFPGWDGLLLFIFVHLILIVMLNFLPFDKWIDRFNIFLSNKAYRALL